MTFSYDETDDFDETDDLDKIDDFDEEPQDAFLEEEDGDPGTALSQAFRAATTGTTEEDDDEKGDDVDADDTEEDDVEDDVDADDTEEDDADEDDVDADDTEEDDADEDDVDADDTEENDTEEDDVDADDTEENDTEEDDVEVDVDADDTEEDDADEDDVDADDTEGIDAYEQRLVKPVDPFPDEDDLEIELLPLEPSPMEFKVEPFRPQEQSNNAYADAVTAYYEEKNYQRAIEKFGEAIEYEGQSSEQSVTDANEIVAKAMYWQAEAYVKLQDLSQAIGTFEDLVKTCQGHYLSLAAQRRAEQLNAKIS